MYFTNTEHDRMLMKALLCSLKATTIGVTSGCFDIMHPLHIQYLEKCQSRCDCLIVGVDSDRLIEETKNKVPVFSEHDRTYMVSSLHCVNVAFVMDNLDTLGELLEHLMENHKGIKEGAVELYKAQTQYYGSPVLRLQGVHLIHIPDVYPINSTTELVRFIQTDYQKL